MQKILAVSISPAKDGDVSEIAEEIKQRQMSFSGVVRRLLRDFKKRGYKFDESAI